MKKLNNKGFSLIEMLIAVTILAVGLLAVAGLQVTAIQGNSQGSSISQATTLAEDRIEAIRNMDYAAISFASNPAIETNVDGTRYKVRLDYGTAAVDFRGAVTNAGV